MSLSKNGRLTLVQVADRGKVYLFDVIALTATTALKEELVANLKSVFENTAIVKILHDCRQDAIALHHQLGVSLVNILDTQVLHAMCETALRAGAPVGDTSVVKRAGLNKLLIDAGLSSNAQKDAVKEHMERSPNFWAQRYANAVAAVCTTQAAQAAHSPDDRLRVGRRPRPGRTLRVAHEAPR